MDDPFRGRRKDENPMRPATDPRYEQAGPEASQQRQFHPSGSAASDWHRLASSGGRVFGAGGGAAAGAGAGAGGGGGGASSAAYGGYYHPEPPEATFSAGPGVPHGAAAAMGYAQPAADYAQDARHTQGYAQRGYGPSGAASMMYGVQQAGGQPGVFDTTAQQPFASRQQHAGIPMMVADVASSSYFTSDSAAASTMAMHSGTSSSLYHQHHGPPPPDGRGGGLVVGFGAGSGHGGGSGGGGSSSNMGTLASSGGYGSQAASNPVHGIPTTATAAMLPTTAAATAAAAGEAVTTAAATSSRDYVDTHESYAAYQRTLVEIFRNIQQGALSPAHELLLSISDWLLSNVESLRLTADDEELYEGRTQLWDNFNHAWLALLEKQKEMMWPGQELHHAQSLVSLEDLKKMARELVRLCDSVERFGLVDYDYGVWEERIMDVLTECVELHGMAEEDVATTSGTGGPGSRQN